MSNADDDFENHSCGLYYPSQNPPNEAFNLFLSGNITPLIAEINQAQYTDLFIGLNIYLEPVADSKLDSVCQLITQIPTVKSFSLGGDITIEQAIVLAKSVAESSLCDFTLIPSSTWNSSLSEYITALSDSTISTFSLNNANLNDAAIDSMVFANTGFTGLSLYSIKASDTVYSKIFKNLYGSNIEDVFIGYTFLKSSFTFDDIDFSQTNVKHLNFYQLQFEEGALAHLHFDNSQVEELIFENNALTDADLGDLSKALQGSNIKYLEIDQGYQDGCLDVSQLNLQDTKVETLVLNLHTSYHWLENLHLEGTNVKFLDLSSSNITDEDLQFLNLKGSNVEHLELDYNEITDSGIQTVIELIKDTHVIDVSIYSFTNGAPGQPGVTKECIIHNEHVLPSDDYVNQITPKTMNEPLNFKDIVNQSALPNDRVVSDVEIVQNNFAKGIEQASFASFHDPLSSFEQITNEVMS